MSRTIPTALQALMIDTIAAEAANLRAHLVRFVPVAQRAGAVRSLAELEYDVTRAIGEASPTVYRHTDDLPRLTLIDGADVTAHRAR